VISMQPYFYPSRRNRKRINDLSNFKEINSQNQPKINFIWL
jgi:hypothetical protein